MVHLDEYPTVQQFREQESRNRAPLEPRILLKFARCFPS
jgi:hypothetical protein